MKNKKAQTFLIGFVLMPMLAECSNTLYKGISLFMCDTDKLQVNSEKLILITTWLWKEDKLNTCHYLSFIACIYTHKMNINTVFVGRLLFSKFLVSFVSQISSVSIGVVSLPYKDINRTKLQLLSEIVYQIFCLVFLNNCVSSLCNKGTYKNKSVSK